MNKRRSYEELIGQLDSALKQGFNLEASWIAYSLFEDRTNSALNKSGGPIPPPKKGYVTIEAKLVELESRSNADANLRDAGINSVLIKEVKDWKNRRNTLMHSLADVARPWEDIDSEAEPLAREGREIFARYSSAIMRLGR